MASKNVVKEIDNSRIQAVLIDEDYLAIGTHVEVGLKQRIEVGAYVDLARLLPRNKVASEEDHRLEMVNKGGMSFWVPIADRELSAINSYIRWEQAFRVYMNVFAKVNPDRVTELLQYNHVIETAAVSYPWDNVYKYDREFRIHMGEHPQWNWGVILQQAWALYMKGSISTNPSQNQQSFKQNQGQGTPFRKTCFKYNRGKCTYGFRCKFDHRCGICGKPGHGAYNCRKAIERTERDRDDYKNDHKSSHKKEHGHGGHRK